MYNAEHGTLPEYVENCISEHKNPINDERLRNQRDYRLPTKMSTKYKNSTIPSAIKHWERLPTNIKSRFTKNSFRYNLRTSLNGIKSKFVSTKLNLSRTEESFLNRTRCDLIFNSHLYAHNFTNVVNPSCSCGHSSQTTKHLFLKCPSFIEIRHVLMTDLALLPSFSNIYRSLSSENDKIVCLLNGHKDMSLDTNNKILKLVAKFIVDLKND